VNLGVSMTVTTLAWTGPFRISDLLAACMDDDHAWPPVSKGVYLVSRDDWRDSPSSACHPLYVGGNTGDSQRFCTRIGDLIADLHGLWDGGTGHHSGGQSLYSWCRTNKVHPGSLRIGWATRTPWCDRCAEVELVSLLATSREERGTLLNKSRPPACRTHGRERGRP
jgi:hypothetical protein